MDALANEWPPVLLYVFPFPLLPAVLAKVRILKHFAAGGTRLALTVMDFRLNRFAGRVTMVSPCQTGHAVSGPGSDLPPKSRVVQVTCLAMSHLGEAVLATLQAAKAPSTWQLHASRWGRFSRWCQSMEIDPFSCQMDSFLSFLLFLLETGVTESTLRGYVTAISDHHEGYGGYTVSTSCQPLSEGGSQTVSISSSANSIMGSGYCLEGSDRTYF